MRQGNICAASCFSINITSTEFFSIDSNVQFICYDCLKALSAANKKTTDKFTPAKNRTRKTRPSVGSKLQTDSTTKQTSTNVQPETRTKTVDEHKVSMDAGALENFRNEIILKLEKMNENIEFKLAHKCDDKNDSKSTLNNILTEITNMSMFLPKLASTEQVNQIFALH